MDKNFLKRRLQQTKIQQLMSSKKNTSYPSSAQMLKNVAGSVYNNASSVLQGNPLKVDGEEATKRLNICESCPFFDKARQRCQKCGCYMAVKTYLRAERCPIGKW
jgi:hypothetical protein